MMLETREASPRLVSRSRSWWTGALLWWEGRFPLHKAGLMCLKSHSLLPIPPVNKPGEPGTLSSKRREWQHPRLLLVSQHSLLEDHLAEEEDCPWDRRNLDDLIFIFII